MISFLKGEFATDKKSTELFRDEWEGNSVFMETSPELIDKLWKQTIATRKKITGT